MKRKKLDFNEIKENDFVIKHYAGEPGKQKQLYWIKKIYKKQRRFGILTIDRPILFQTQQAPQIHLFENATGFYFTRPTQNEIKKLLKTVTKVVEEGNLIITKLKESSIQ